MVFFLFICCLKDHLYIHAATPSIAATSPEIEDGQTTPRAATVRSRLWSPQPTDSSRAMSSSTAISDLSITKTEASFSSSDTASLIPEYVGPLKHIERQEYEERPFLPPRAYVRPKGMDPTIPYQNLQVFTIVDASHRGCGPVARAPYTGYISQDGTRTVQHSPCLGGSKIFHLLNLDSMKRFGILRWYILEKEGEIFDYDIPDEDKVIQCLWARWIFLNRYVP
jgi:hypothetical protein